MKADWSGSAVGSGVGVGGMGVGSTMTVTCTYSITGSGGGGGAVVTGSAVVQALAARVRTTARINKKNFDLGICIFFSFQSTIFQIKHEIFFYTVTYLAYQIVKEESLTIVN
jgi:hypothetical protein